MNKHNDFSSGLPDDRVLDEQANKSVNFYRSDRIFHTYIQKSLDKGSFRYIEDKLDQMGKWAAGELGEHSQNADRFPPELIKRTPYGEPLDEIRFHPSYHEMLKGAASSEMLYLKWNPELRKKFNGFRHRMGFAIGHLFACTEIGLYCPLCMTDGAAYVLDLFADKSDAEQLLPLLSAKDAGQCYTGAMFLTEKTGGSDVGSNRTRADHIEGKWYRLNGEKWFCSNANADVMLVLARTDPGQPGTRGLSLFLVTKQLPDGGANPMEIIRLKNKLGVRSMATAEIKLTDTRGKLIGRENEGFRMMAEMINMSRLYNAVTAAAGARRSIAEAYGFLKFRKLFGKDALDQPLIRDKLEELGSRYVAVFLLVWRAVKALDEAETGNNEEKERFRLLVPMAKWNSAEEGVYMARESMELMGGLGYIEDTVMPRLYRDILVLPIWEGSGNVIVLDMVRAARKTGALQLLIGDIEEAADQNSQAGEILNREVKRLRPLISEITGKEGESVESLAKPLFRRLIRLYQIALIIIESDKENAAWMETSLRYLLRSLTEDPAEKRQPVDRHTVENLVAWEI